MSCTSPLSSSIVTKAVPSSPRGCWRAMGQPATRSTLPSGEDGTAFVTIEDESGEVQLILWPRIFARYRRELRSQVLLVRGTVSRYDGTTNLAVTHVEPVGAGVPMPEAHDWH